LTDAAKEAKLGAHVALVSTRFRSFAPGGGVRFGAGQRDYFLCIWADYWPGCGGKLTEKLRSFGPPHLLVRGIFALWPFLSYSAPPRNSSFHGKRQLVRK
jgi:hypothetical protein